MKHVRRAYQVACDRASSATTSDSGRFELTTEEEKDTVTAFLLKAHDLAPTPADMEGKLYKDVQAVLTRLCDAAPVDLKAKPRRKKS